MSKYKVGDKIILQIDKRDNIDGTYRVKNANGQTRWYKDIFVDSCEPYNPTDTAEDAWELMKNIDSDMTLEEKRTVFWHNTMIEILKTNTYALAKEKYRIWKDMQKIKVGDEVVMHDDELSDHYIVTFIKDNSAEVMDESGVFGVEHLNVLKKTGRHFDLAPMFEFMRGGDDHV